MKLYLAVATLMLVLLAHCEAEEPTIEQHFANIQEKLQEFGSDISSKAADAWKEIQKSDTYAKAKNWASEIIEQASKKFEETFNKPQ